MPRRYAYEHFKVPKRETRERSTLPDSLKEATSKKGEAVPLAESQEGLHYGRKNAETVKRLHMSAQQRHLGGAKAKAPATRAKAKAPATRAKAKAPARGLKVVERVAAAAKKSVKRVAKKVTPRGSAKKR